MERFFCCRKEESRVIIQGLDSAGKTSLLYYLKLGRAITTIPTPSFNLETVEWPGISLVCWDIGNRDKSRPIIRHYYPNTQGFIFMVDSNDRERLDEALDEFIKLVVLEDLVKDAVVMVMANKQDLPGAMTAQEIEDAVKKRHIFSKDSSHTVFVMPCSVATAEGVHEAVDYFVEQLRLKKAGKAQSGLITQSQQASQMTLGKKGQSKTCAIALKSLFKNPIGYFKSFLYR